MNTPLKKKIPKSSHTSIIYRNILSLYDDLPMQINDVSQLDAYRKLPQMAFLISLTNRESATKRLEKKLYKYKYIATTSIKNRPIYSVLKDLKDKRTASNTRKELEQRFSGQEYNVQIKILKKLFAHNKISARLAIRLMAQNNIWEDWALEHIMRELQFDKGVTTTIKTAGVEIIEKHAQREQLLLHEDFVQSYMSYYFRCMNGFETNIDKSRLFPMEYLDFCFSSTSDLKNVDYIQIYIGAIKYEITNKKYLDIKSKKSWVPSLIFLMNTQIFLALAVIHNRIECVYWLYALDRNMQHSIKDYPIWKKFIQSANGSSSSNEEIARAMDCYYSCVMEYISANNLNGDISDFRLTMAEPLDENLPF